MINILIDLIILALIAGGVIYGYRKGIFRMTVGPFKRLLCFVLSFSYSGIVGANLIAPIITNGLDINDDFKTVIVNYVSCVIAFVLLFWVSKTTLSITINAIDRILNIGLISIVNKGVGMAFSAMITFGILLFASSIMIYLLNNGYLDKIAIFNDFTGGPVFSFFASISPFDKILTVN
jgi:hypothetical protein